jgi:hypothetical protein
MRHLAILAAFTLVIAMPATAHAQSWGRGGAYTGAGGTSQGYYPRTGVHSCNWSVTASCAAWRNGTYERGGIKHQLVKRFPNGRWTIRVYQGNTRVK